MIQKKFPVIYGDRGERQGIIMLEVRPMEMTPNRDRIILS
jgi:hypothetical protein